MSSKRLAEQRFLGDRASSYRMTYQVYTPRSLLVLTVLYGFVSFALFLGAASGEGSRVVFTAPLVAMQLGWVVKLALERESVMMDPERAYRKPWFFFYSFLVLGLIIYLAGN
jgi:hypothetical protein